MLRTLLTGPELGAAAEAAAEDSLQLAAILGSVLGSEEDYALQFD